MDNLSIKYLTTILFFLILVGCNNENESQNSITLLKAPILDTSTLNTIKLSVEIDNSKDISVLFENTNKSQKTPDMSDMVILINGISIQLEKNSTNHFTQSISQNNLEGDSITFTVDYNGSRLIDSVCSIPDSLNNFSISTEPTSLTKSPLDISEFNIHCEKISDYCYYLVEFFENINDISPTDYYRTLSTNSIDITKDKYKYGSYYGCDFIDITVNTVNCVAFKNTLFSDESFLLVNSLNKLTKSNRN